MNGCDKTMSSNVENLVAKSKKGDTVAFGDLYEIYSVDMFRFAYYYTGSKSLAEDCVSEAVLIAFRKIGELKNISLSFFFIISYTGTGGTFIYLLFP